MVELFYWEDVLMWESGMGLDRYEVMNRGKFLNRGDGSKWYEFGIGRWGFFGDGGYEGGDGRLFLKSKWVMGLFGWLRIGGRDVLVEGYWEVLVIKENGVVVGDDLVNVISDGLVVERWLSMFGIFSSERGLLVYFNFDISLGLFG